MPVFNDLTDRLSRLTIPYGRHVVKGYLTKHSVEMIGTQKQVTIQRALGKGPWDSAEKRYYAGFEIAAEHHNFHQGLPGDAPDVFFPTDIAHPNAAYESTRLPDGMGDEDNPDEMVGIYKTLQVANYDGAGVETGFGYSASPARVVADLRLRAKRLPVHINYPSWVDWRDYCAELINWDDGALTPHQIFLTRSAGGSLDPATYWIRVATLKGADISSASKDRSTSDPLVTASIVISGADLQFTVEWASQIERAATGYRVYIGTAEGAEDRYFEVNDGAINTLLISTLVGATMGVPPEIATGALLRQIPRFESHVFFVPPFDLSAAMDRIAQITCMDWHYANGKLVFLTPEIRDPVFTLNVAEITNFKTWQIDRRQRPNQIIVSYRDLDSPYLAQADPPVTINRLTLQAVEGVRPYEINMGCAYRSQAERCGHFWARRLIDSDQMFEGLASPKAYIVLPGDPVFLTHNVPNWEDVSFYIEEKEESEDTKAGYQVKGRIYGEWYSDTDHEPLPRPFPTANPNHLIAPPVVEDVTLTEDAVHPIDAMPFTVIRGGVEFAPFVGHQRGRVWWAKPSVADPDVSGDYEPTQILLYPHPTTSEAAFELTGVALGRHTIKVVTESTLGVSLPFATHDPYEIVITGDAIRPPAMTDAVVTIDASNHWLETAIGHPRPSEEPASYEVLHGLTADWTNEAANTVLTLPMVAGASQAALLAGTTGGWTLEEF